MICCTRRHSLLLEVLISFAIVALCILPLLYPHVYILQSQKKMIQTVELDHIVNLVYGNTLEKLYLNEIPWDTIINQKETQIDDQMVTDCGFGCPTPYTGTFKFKEIKHKPKKIQDKALYLFLLTFDFHRKDAKPINGKEEKHKVYEYQVLIEKRA